MTVSTWTIMPAGEGKILSIAPYHPEWLRRAKYVFNGKWDADKGGWVFDARLMDKVQETLTSIFGAPSEPRVDVELALDEINPSGYALWLLGRLIAERRHRDAPVRLGPGVSILQGGFQPRGGSMKYPDLAPLPGTTLLVLDVPLSLAQSASLSHGITIRETKP